MSYKSGYSVVASLSCKHTVEQEESLMERWQVSGNMHRKQETGIMVYSMTESMHSIVGCNISVGTRRYVAKW